MASNGDNFGDLAHYYDRLMDHVDYDRWFMVTTTLAQLLPEPFVHFDAACGTGTLVKMLLRANWPSRGFDLSHAMLRAGRKGPLAPSFMAADLRALPLHGSVDFITCLFDSVNFLLSLDDVRAAFRELHGALRPGGMLYFDVVTERMITEYFDGEEWTERNGRFTTRWASDYDRATGITETSIRVNNGPACVFRERVYSLDQIQRAVEDAGFTMLGTYDAKNWKSPKRKTLRVDYVAVKGAGNAVENLFGDVRDDVRAKLA